MIIAILRGVYESDLHSSQYGTMGDKDKLIIDYFTMHEVKVVHVFLSDRRNKHERFKNHRKFVGGQLIELGEKIKPDVIWNMCGSHTSLIHTTISGIPIVSSYHLSLVANDKSVTYDYFKKHQPKSSLLHEFLDNTSIQDSFGDTVVIKPLFGSKGQGVEKRSKEELVENKEFREKYGRVLLVQDLLETSSGYPGISETTHDVRIYFVGKKPISSIVRESGSKDDFRACVNLGGRADLLSLSTLPDQLISDGFEISQKLEPKKIDFYSLDFAYCSKKEKRFLIEVNSAPGFRLEGGESLEDSRALKAIYKAFTKYL